MHTGLEIELPREKKRLDYLNLGRGIVTTDDPRWIDCQRAVMRAWEAQDDAAMDLLNIRPTDYGWGVGTAALRG